MCEDPNSISFLAIELLVEKRAQPYLICPPLPSHPTPSISNSDKDDKEEDKEEKTRTPSSHPVPAKLSGLSHASTTRASQRIMNVSPPQDDAANDTENSTASKPSHLNKDITQDVTKD